MVATADFVDGFVVDVLDFDVSLVGVPYLCFLLRKDVLMSENDQQTIPVAVAAELITGRIQAQDALARDLVLLEALALLTAQLHRARGWWTLIALQRTCGLCLNSRSHRALTNNNCWTWWR